MKHLVHSMIALSAVLFLPPGEAQAQAVAKSYPGNSHQERVAAFMADPAHADVVAKAKAGDPAAMVALAELIERKLLGGDYSGPALLEMRMKLLAGAQAKGYGPAFLKMGRMVADNQTPSGTLGDAYQLFLAGAKLGDKESLREAARLAVNPNACSICRPSSGRLQLVDTEGTIQFLPDKLDPLEWAYIKEKQSMIAEVRAMLIARAKPEHDVFTESLISLYLSGVPTPWTAMYFADKRARGEKWIVAPEGTKAIPLLEAIAANKPRESWAPTMLGLWYANPKDSGIAKDPVKAMRWLERAAYADDAGSADAAQLLGHELVTGKQWPRDMAKAQTLLKLAASKGHVEATYDLGLINMLGMAGAKDPHQAADYFRTAIAKGHAASATAMGQMYRDGDLGKKDPVMMNYYFNKAAELQAQNKAGQATLDKLQALAN